MAKDKKYKGGPARKSYLQNMAKQGGRSGDYSKYGDYNPENVHDETSVDYRGIPISNSPTGNINNYSKGVAFAGKSVFRFNNKLYRHLDAYGTSYEEVKV